MEIKAVKQELKEYIDNKRYLEQKQDEIKRLEELLTKVTTTYSDLPKGGSGGKEELIIKKIDLETETYKYLIELMEKKALIERTLHKLEPLHRNILDFLYIQGKTLVEFASNVGYSYRQAIRLLKDAYREYAEVRNER